MFGVEYIWDAVVWIIALLLSGRTWDSKRKELSNFFVKIALVVLFLGAALLFTANRHNLLFFAQASEGAEQMVAGTASSVVHWWQRLPWLRLALTFVIGVWTFFHARQMKKPRSWLGDKVDKQAYWSTIATGLCLAVAMVFVGHFVSFLAFVLAIMSVVVIMNVQVPEQELWTPKLFGQRYFGAQWMLGRYCFTNGWHWMLLPRNFPGLSFNVVKPRRGVQLRCMTAKVPTKGFTVKGEGNSIEKVGGEVDVPFLLIIDTHQDLDAFYASPDEIRDDTVKLAAYAAGIYGAEFRELIKGLSLDEVQVGDVFSRSNFDRSRAIFESNTGHSVKACLVEDATPSKEVQDQINALAAKRIEKAQAELEAQIEEARQRGVGKGRLAQLESLAEALRDPDQGASIREALAAVRSMDFAANSNLRVLVERELGPLEPLTPLIAEGSAE